MLHLMAGELLQQQRDIHSLQVREPECELWPDHVEILMRVLPSRDQLISMPGVLCVPINRLQHILPCLHTIV